MTEPKPLIPVNLEGLEALANELLMPATSPRSEEGIPSLENPSSYILLPANNHGSYSYSDMLVAKNRLGYDGDVDKVGKKLGLTLRNTAKERDGHDYIGNINHAQSLDLNKGLGNITLTQRQYIDFFLLLKSGNVNDGAGNRVAKSEIENILDEIVGKRNPWRSEWTSNKFKDISGALNIIYPVFKGGKWQEIIEPLEPYVKENCYVDLASFNRQGMPTRKSTQQEYKFGENIYYYFPVDGTVAGFGADSSRARLNCNGDPSNCGASLGVRTSRAKI